jgi:hypothetical protein
MKVLALEIKFLIQKINRSVYIFGKVQFIIYQIIHFCGILIYFKGGDQSQGEDVIITYITIILFLGTYQYIEFYLLFVFFVLVLPFYMLRKLYVSVKLRYQIYQMQKQMRGQKYNENKVKGDR